jgi:hypothetical protein
MWGISRVAEELLASYEGLCPAPLSYLCCTLNFKAVCLFILQFNQLLRLLTAFNQLRLRPQALLDALRMA